MVVIKTLNTKGGEGAVDQRGGGGVKVHKHLPIYYCLLTHEY